MWGKVLETVIKGAIQETGKALISEQTVKRLTKKARVHGEVIAVIPCILKRKDELALLIGNIAITSNILVYSQFGFNKELTSSKTIPMELFTFQKIDGKVYNALIAYYGISFVFEKTDYVILFANKGNLEIFEKSILKASKK